MRPYLKTQNSRSYTINFRLVYRLHALPGREKIPSHPIKTIGEVCRQQGQKLIEELILLANKRLQGGQSATDVFSHLFAKQGMEVAA